MQSSIQNPTPERPAPNNGGSGLRTVVGNRFERRCSCGCAQVLPADPTLKVVVDFGAPKPFPTYLAAHSPDAGTYRGRPRAREGSRPVADFTPANALPAPPPKAPEPPLAPAPAPLALLAAGAASEPTPSSSAGVAWATSQLTFNAGPYESAKSGFADYAQAGESPEQLRARVNRVVLEDIERQVRGIRELHERLGDAVKPFPSAARAAGAPPGGASVASPASPPRMITPPTSPAVGGTPPSLCALVVGVGRGPEGVPARDGPTVADLVARINLELGDTSVRRKRAKEAAVRKLCELRGLASLRQASSADQAALEALVAIMDSINDWDLHAALGVPAPQLDDRLVLPA